DSPEQYYNDIINHPDHRYNDRDVVRAFTEWSAPTFEWLVELGGGFPDKAPGRRKTPSAWENPRNQGPMWGGGVGPLSPTGANGTAVVRPLEAAARRLGVQILLEHSLTGIVRDTENGGRVRGITATTKGKPVTIQARKGVIIGTGGHTSNI